MAIHTIHDSSNNRATAELDSILAHIEAFTTTATSDDHQVRKALSKGFFLKERKRSFNPFFLE